MGSFAMPLQIGVTSDRLIVWVMGGDGQILFGLPHPGPDGLARLKQIVEMANRADKALEACKVLLESNRNPKDLRLYWAAVDKAREAVEMDVTVTIRGGEEPETECGAAGVLRGHGGST